MSTAPPRQSGRVPGRLPPRLPAPLLALPLLVFALLTWQVLADGPLLRADERVSRWLVRPDRAGELLSDLGNVQVALPVLLIVAVYVARRGWTAGVARWWPAPLAALVCLALVPLVVVPVKNWTDRPGPPSTPRAPGTSPPATPPPRSWRTAAPCWCCCPGCAATGPAGGPSPWARCSSSACRTGSSGGASTGRWTSWRAGAWERCCSARWARS